MIYCVEDDDGIRELVVYTLQNTGMDAKGFADGQALFAALKNETPTLILLDIMLPGEDGIAILRRLRAQEATASVPVILLTANDLETDIVTGLTLGADDYITKPFNPLELVARIKTQLRRYLRYDHAGQPAKMAAEDDSIQIRGLSISRSQHKCTLNGKELTITPTEFNILWYLCSHQGKAISSEELFEAVWGEKYLDSNNTVMAHIARLREKMQEPARRPKYIKTIWGVGYTIE